MMTIDEIIEQKKQDAIALKETIELLEQKATDEEGFCCENHKQIAKWLKELQNFRKEHKNLEEPFCKDYKHLINDLEELAYLADELAFSRNCIEGSYLEVPIEHRFIWRSVREIAWNASHFFKRVEYIKKENGDNYARD